MLILRLKTKLKSKVLNKNNNSTTLSLTRRIYWRGRYVSLSAIVCVVSLMLKLCLSCKCLMYVSKQFVLFWNVQVRSWQWYLWLALALTSGALPGGAVNSSTSSHARRFQSLTGLSIWGGAGACAMLFLSCIMSFFSRVFSSCSSLTSSLIFVIAVSRSLIVCWSLCEVPLTFSDVPPCEEGPPWLLSNATLRFSESTRVFSAATLPCSSLILMASSSILFFSACMRLFSASRLSFSLATLSRSLSSNSLSLSSNFLFLSFNCCTSDLNDFISSFKGAICLSTSALINWAVPNPVGSGCHGVTAGV